MPSDRNATADTEGPGSSLRSVDRVVPAVRMLEGAGFPVNRPLPSAGLELLDPFLLLDEMAPVEVSPGKAIGAPAHPHRGFETVTYILQGEVEHRDSMGNHGIVGPGDVQWMTAGDGIVHSELPSERVQTQGGVGHGLQLWVNLPSELRRTRPKYQALLAEQIPTVRGDGWVASVIAGDVFDVSGPAQTHTPMTLARITVEPGASLSIPAADGHNAAIYAFGGQCLLGAERTQLNTNELAVFAPVGGDIAVSVRPAADASLDALVMTGQPIGEPIARSGPFVMNTDQEIADAIEDFHAGRMGTISASGSP